MTDDKTTPPALPTVLVPAQSTAAAPRPGRMKHLRRRGKPTWGVVGWSIFVVVMGVVVGAGLSIGLWSMFRGVLPWHDAGRGKVEGIDLVKLALSVVAGAGGAVALTVSVLKQRILERDAEGQRAVDAAFRSRYGEAATQLGSDRAAVQLAGVYAMANLADDWPEQRQQCVDVLCGFLRLPPPTDDALKASDAKVRTTIGAVLRDHLQKDGLWCSLDFNLTGAYLVDLNLDGALFAGKNTSFVGAEFAGKKTSFEMANFAGQTISFSRANFASEDTSFDKAEFTGEKTTFDKALFAGEYTSFIWAKFTGEKTSFGRAEFTGATTLFTEVEFTGENTSFTEAKFTGEKTAFYEAEFTGENTSFDKAEFTGEYTLFTEAEFTGKNTSFTEAKFTAKNTSFDEAKFTGEYTSFDKAEFTGEKTSFYEAKFTGEKTSFHRALFAGEYTSFLEAEFTGKTTSFSRAKFTAKNTLFDGAKFTGEREAVFAGVSIPEDAVRKARFGVERNADEAES